MSLDVRRCIRIPQRQTGGGRDEYLSSPCGSPEYFDAFPKRWDISYFAIHVGVPPAPRPCPRPSKIPSIASRHHVERDAHEVLAARPLDEILPVLMGTNALIPIPSLRPSPLVQEYGIPAQEGTRLAAYP